MSTNEHFEITLETLKTFLFFVNMFLNKFLSYITNNYGKEPVPFFNLFDNKF